MLDYLRNKYIYMISLEHARNDNTEHMRESGSFPAWTYARMRKGGVTLRRYGEGITCCYR